MQRADFVDVAVVGVGAGLFGYFIPKVSIRDAIIFTVASSLLSKVCEKYFEEHDYSKKWVYPLCKMGLIPGISHSLLKIPASTILSLKGMEILGTSVLSSYRVVFPYQNQKDTKIDTLHKVVALLYPIQSIAMLIIGRTLGITTLDIVKTIGLSQYTYQLKCDFSSFLFNNFVKSTRGK